MPDKSWTTIRERAAADVGDDGNLRMLFPALAGGRDSGHGFTLMPFGTLYRLAGRAAEGVRTRRILAATGFPVRSRMIIGLGEHHMFVWSASKQWAYGRWRIGRLVGTIPIDHVSTAEAPTVGQGWRTVVLQLTGKSPASLRVPAPVVNELVQALTGRVG